MSDLLHDRGYVLGDAVKGIADALQRNTDNSEGVCLGAALEVIGAAVTKLAEDIEMASHQAERASVTK